LQRLTQQDDETILIRSVYFAFHYERDVWRANVVRNSWVTKPDRAAAGFVDAAEFEKVKARGEDAVKRWILNQLEGTSVTVVLIGSETSTRPYVDFEIQESYKRKNGLLGVHIYKIENQEGKEDTPGQNPFETFTVNRDGRAVRLSELYPVYYWFRDKGYDNLPEWIETAARQAGR